MRLIYICEKCNSYIDEIELLDIDESVLGFNTLTSEERDELVKLDWNRQIGTVRSICDNCLNELAESEDELSQVAPGIH